MSKSIDTLLTDIFSLLATGGHEPDAENLKALTHSISEAITGALKEENDLSPRAELRLSKTGTPLRKVWFEHNYKFANKSELDPNEVGPNLMRFLTGHITEAVLLFLAREAGHTVEQEQKTVTVAGIDGHLDAVIDGHLVDVKTASQFGYDKFKTADIVWGKDPFGYIQQLSAYKKGLLNSGVELKPNSYFWANNKSNSEMFLTLEEDAHIVDAEALLTAQKEAVKSPSPPEALCYPEEEAGKSGNMKVNDQCKYCPFKYECFKNANDGQGLRVFKYAKGPEFLTKVIDKPKVEEIT
mgnify:CR=1 FL=1